MRPHWPALAEYDPIFDQGSDIRAPFVPQEHAAAENFRTREHGDLERDARSTSLLNRSFSAAMVRSSRVRRRGSATKVDRTPKPGSI